MGTTLLVSDQSGATTCVIHLRNPSAVVCPWSRARSYGCYAEASNFYATNPPNFLAL